MSPEIYSRERISFVGEYISDREGGLTRIERECRRRIRVIRDGLKSEDIFSCLRANLSLLGLEEAKSGSIGYKVINKLLTSLSLYSGMTCSDISEAIGYGRELHWLSSYLGKHIDARNLAEWRI